MRILSGGIVRARDDSCNNAALGHNERMPVADGSGAVPAGGSGLTSEMSPARRLYLFVGDLLANVGLGALVGLEVRRVLKPGGTLHMFEHTGSRYFPFNVMLHALTPLSRKVGPDLNRDTVANVQRARFRGTSVERVFLDVVNVIHAIRS